MTRTEEFVQVAKCLEHLEEAGWTELIDSRFEEDVVKELTTKFPNLPENIIEEVLNLVLV
jgi:hypothetical protein